MMLVRLDVNHNHFLPIVSYMQVGQPLMIVVDDANEVAAFANYEGTAVSGAAHNTPTPAAGKFFSIRV